MPNKIEFHAGAMVKCPSCLQEVPLSQVPDSPELPFRCDGCKRRSSDTLTRLLKAKETSDATRQGQTDNNDSSKPAASRSNRSRDRTVEQKPVAGTVVDEPMGE